MKTVRRRRRWEKRSGSGRRGTQGGRRKGKRGKVKGKEREE